MNSKLTGGKRSAEHVVKDIRRATRRHFSSEDKIRIVLDGLRGEDSIAELCRKEGIAQSLYYTWSKEFLEAGKRRLAGDTARAATTGEVQDLRRETRALKEAVADLTLENRLLMRREADIAVRMVRPTQGTLVARRLGDLPLGLFAHRNYLDRVGRPTKLEDLKGHTMIGPDRDAAGLSGLDAFGKALGRMDLRLRADSEAAQIASVRAGLGIGVLQRGVAARDDMLEPVLAEAVKWTLDAWLVLHDDLRKLPMIRLVADHLSTVLPHLLRDGHLPT